MDKIIEVFEKSLAAYQEQVGKVDNLVGTGQILVTEFKKQREQIVTLGRLLADFYAKNPEIQAEIYQRQAHPNARPQ